jgi:hypothetical protein
MLVAAGAARSLNPGLSFATADGYDVAALLALQASSANGVSAIGGGSECASGCASIGGAFTVCFVDIGGLSGPDGLLEALALLRQLSSAMPTLRVAVIKSTCVQRHARGLLAGRKFLAYLHAQRQ